MARALEVLRNGDSIDRLVERSGNVELASRAGHMFEAMHALSFNLDAIANDATVRARVTESMAVELRTARWICTWSIRTASSPTSRRS